MLTTTGRECYCAQWLSGLSAKLNESAFCNIACDGNGSQICGGINTLTLYNVTVQTKSGGAGILEREIAVLGAFATSVFVLIAVL